jgi:DNA-binding transcriptional ArsR family regulator
MSLDPLSQTMFALADPTRRAILARLSTGEATVNELAAPFDMSLPAVSKHLKVLERANLITRSRTAQWRPCRLDPEPLKAVDGWLGDYRKLWEHRLDRLENYLATLKKPEEKTEEDHG